MRRTTQREGDAMSRRSRPRVLAVASGGGHFVQLMRLRAAFEGCDLAVVTVKESYRGEADSDRFYVIHDATRWDKPGLLLMAAQLLRILVKERPDVVISTGAAPGYFAIRFARLFRARTIWLDSVANVEQVSLSGARIAPHANLTLTQWPDLAKGRIRYFGATV